MIFVYKRIYLSIFVLLCAFNFSKVHASNDQGIQFYIGPEIYYVDRLKEGGGKQTGVLYGIRAGYERIKRYKFYYALEGLYSQGTLNGKSNNNHVRSEFSNSTIETRFGYTFQCKYWPGYAFTPYVGFGYMWEYSRYKNPTPIKVHFDNRFPYIPFGFISSMFVTKQLQVGLNVKVRFLWDGKQKVTHDPEFNSLIQCYEDHFQYRVEFPIAYYFCWRGETLAVRLTPFYEYRHYGHSINYPFDFLDTKYKFYGANLELIYRF